MISNDLFIRKKASDRVPKMAIVTGITEAGVTLDRPLGSGDMAYTRLSSYTPAIGDRVYLAPVSGTYIVLGKVV